MCSLYNSKWCDLINERYEEFIFEKLRQCIMSKINVLVTFCVFKLQCWIWGLWPLSCHCFASSVSHWMSVVLSDRLCQSVGGACSGCCCVCVCVWAAPVVVTPAAVSTALWIVVNNTILYVLCKAVARVSQCIICLHLNFSILKPRQFMQDSEINIACSDPKTVRNLSHYFYGSV